MAKSVYKLILKTLCNNQGSLDFQSLNEQVSQSFTVAEEILRSVLFDDGTIAIEEGKDKARGSILGPDSVIVAKTGLRLCQDKSCPGCANLHLCRYYVCRESSFNDKCKNSHLLTSPHNASVLGLCDLRDLTEKQLFQLLLQNDPYLLPEICSHYNKGACRFPDTCTKLHICLHFLQGDCRYGSNCKRAHAIDAQGMKLFKYYSSENITGLYKIYRNKLIILGQRARPAALFPEPIQGQTLPNKPRTPANPVPPKAVSDSEICLFFVRRQCSYKERCVFAHWHLPYKWEMWEGQSQTWKSMDNMEEIEKAYCDPANGTSCTDGPTSPSGLLRFLNLQSFSAPSAQCVDFVKMTYGAAPVRRLSTSSSVSNPPNFILTTEWLWYWKDDTGLWMEYGSDGTDRTPASLSVQTLENLYLADRQAETEFTAGSQRYKLSFKGGHGFQMYQQNTKYHTVREVRRRPRFVSAQDVEAKLKSKSSAASLGSSSSSADTVPANWDKNALPEIGYKLVHLSTSSSEYHMVQKLFRPTMPSSRITNIQRIQNPSLWRVFQWQKEQMKKRNGGKAVNEKHLFHGTDRSLIDAICDQNFDWRMCGIHGTSYGKGSYFARDASYSHKYTKGLQGRVMFVALVLVGESTLGQSSYVRPPAKGTGSALYDSCVNRDTSIFVIFEKQQIYPEYLIEYV